MFDQMPHCVIEQDLSGEDMQKNIEKEFEKMKKDDKDTEEEVEEEEDDEEEEDEV